MCHTGSATCFDQPTRNQNFLIELERIINERQNDPKDGSYTSRLFQGGLNRTAQKVGEEAVELVIAAFDHDGASFEAEAADLLYHFLVLLKAKGVTFEEVVSILAARHRESADRTAK